MSTNDQGGRPIEHGIRPLEAAYAANRIDPESELGKLLNQKRLDLAKDAGGLERMTNRELAILDRCAFQVLVLDSIEGYVLSRGPLTRRGLMRNVLAKQYIAHVNALRRNLEALHLRPEKVERLPTLQEYLASKSVASASPQTSAETEVTDTPAPGSPRSPATTEEDLCAGA